MKVARGTITLTPFARTRLTTAECMMLVIFAMLPSAGFGLYSYGAHALYLILISVGSAVAFEAVWELVTGRKITIGDMSAAVTGMCLAMIMPPSAPLWFPVLGNAVAILFAKQLFGGIGKNFLNPAATGKLILVLIFHKTMTDFSGGGYGSDTPLMVLTEGGTIDLGQMILGNVPGCIGTASTICVLIGAAILFLTGIIRLDIPLSALLSFLIFMILFGGHGFSGTYLTAQIAGGSFLFTAFFMANDFATSPVGKRARIVYGILIGILTGVFRILGSRENAALYALFLSNFTARFLDVKLAQRPFGTRQVRRRTRIRSQRTPEQEQKEQEAEEEQEREIAENFQDFEDSVVPNNAQKGSETAGTINEESMALSQNRSELHGNPTVPPQQAPFLDPNMPTGTIPPLQQPYVDPNMQNPYQTGPIPPVDPYLQQGQQVQQPYADPNAQNPYNPGYAPQGQQGYSGYYPQQGPYAQQPYGYPQNPDPNYNPNYNAGYDSNVGMNPAYGGQQPQNWYGAPQQPYMNQNPNPGSEPGSPLQMSNLHQGRTEEDIAEEEEERRRQEEAEAERLEAERKARRERIHRSPKAVEARLIRNRKKRLENSEALEEELREKQRAREEMRNAVQWDNDEDSGDVSDSLQYIDLTQDNASDLNFDAEQEKNEQERSEDASLAGLLTENIPVEEIERQLVRSKAPEQNPEEDPYGTPAEEPKQDKGQ